jgi:hypothetical protein
LAPIEDAFGVQRDVREDVDRLRYLDVGDSELRHHGLEVLLTRRVPAGVPELTEARRVARCNEHVVMTGRRV